MALLKTEKRLGFGDYLTMGVRSLFVIHFSGPVIGLGVIAGFIVQTAVGNAINDLSGGSTNGLGGLFSAVGISLISGLIVGLYGLVYAVTASTSKTAPTFQIAMSKVGDRWASILGAGLLSILLTFGILVLGLLVVGGGAAVSQSGPATLGLLLIFGFVYMYLQLRLGQAQWFAADGAGAVDSLKISWEKTQGHLWRILGWSIGGGIVFSIISNVLGLVFSVLPSGIAVGITTGVTLCLTYGSGAVLYRRITGK